MTENDSSIKVYENSPPIPVPADTNMHASLTLSKVNLYQHSKWNFVITKLIEMKITPEDALSILSRSLNHTNSAQAVTVEEKQNKDLSNQSDNLNMRKTIIAEFTVTVDLMDVPDEINLKHKIKFEVVNNYTSGKVVKSEYETTSDVVKICDHKHSTNETENNESIENVFENLNDQDTLEIKQTIFTPNQIQVVVQNLKDNLNSQFIGTVYEYNILLLGEIGAGKSTTINALANYMKYASFEEAKAGEFAQLIPTKFSLVDPHTGKSVVVQSGSDANESPNKMGKSCTQSPVSYLFKNGNNHVRIIDTPGMGDTRGVEVDSENFDQIINFIIHFKNLHGICILIPSNETRKTSSFRYCITELLANLHRSACKNIFFCFTFARYTNFGAGDGYLILKSFLQNELRENGLNLSPEVNCFFIENEAYRYLVAKKSGFEFDKEEEEKCQDSWTMSSINANLMIDRVMQLAPHDIEQTRQLNYTQKLLMLLAEPLVLLQRNCHINISEIEMQIETLKLFHQKSKSSKSIFIQTNIVYLDWVTLKSPKTVCTESRCVKFTDRNSADQSCHNSCEEIFTPNGSTQLKKCSKMSENGSCTKCGCDWRKHMHLTAQYIHPKGYIIKQDVLNTPAGKINEALKKCAEMHQSRLKVLEIISAKLAFLAQKHSNTSSKKFIEPILDKLIEAELTRLKNSENKTETVKNILAQMKECHIKRVQDIADKVSVKSSKDIKFEYVSACCEKLTEIKPLNKVLKSFNDYQEKESREFKQCDVVFEF